MHLEWVIEIVLCFCLQLFVHQLSHGGRGRTGLDLLYCPFLEEWGLPVQAGAAGGGWERRKYLKAEVEEEGTVSFEFWKMHVLCGFNVTISLLWLPSFKGISSGPHNYVWVSWRSWPHCTKLNQELLSPHFHFPSGAEVRNQISPMTSDMSKHKSAFLPTSNQWRNLQEHRKGLELQHPVYLALSFPAAVIKEHICLIIALLILYLAFIKTLNCA